MRENKSGFTLVELLVVVAIIAILSVIGLTLFTGAQNNARDARRKSDIDAIAAALEAKRAPGTVWYSTIDGSAFSAGTIPVDSTTAKYCIKVYTTDSGAKETDPTTWASTGVCPTGFLQAIISSPAVATDGFNNASGSFFVDSTNKSFKVCARLESSTATSLKVYCKPSSQ